MSPLHATQAAANKAGVIAADTERASDFRIRPPDAAQAADFGDGSRRDYRGPAAGMTGLRV
jgi:hypothetical protein